MKTSRETLLNKLLCVNTNTHLLNKEKKLYFLFLHEDFYGFIIDNNNGFFVSKFSEKEEVDSFFLKNNSNKYRKGSFLTAKYIITFLRFKNFSEDNFPNNMLNAFPTAELLNVILKQFWVLELYTEA